MRPLKSSPILRNGPFLSEAGPNRLNLGLLALLLPALISALAPGARPGGPAWAWPPALLGAFLSALLFAPRRRRALLDLDWAAAAVLGGLMLNFPGQRELEPAAGFFCGLLAGLMTVRGPGRKLLWLPGLIPLVAALGALAGISAVRHFLAPEARGFFPLWGAGGRAQLWALAAAGLCLAGGRRPGLLLAVPWLAAVCGWLFLPPWSPGPQALSPAAGLLWPLFFILPQLFHRLFLKRPPAGGRPVFENSPEKAYLQCAHQGRAPRLAEWAGLPSCRLAAAHDGGPLLCPYGCLALGDCLRACPQGAISLNGNGFPEIDRSLCRGCGRCRAVCPKSLFELGPPRARVFIPCRAASPLKKNAAYCPAACLGCGRCRKACPAGAVGRAGTFGALAIDQELCRAGGDSCGLACLELCPRHIIRNIPGS
ncbi:MAG: 4Fe-4S binding protein [Candidatus Adiutrix sp.]|jgi:Fe-S-cluster-containing hydrogenase component 2|nr:4Fe-4S binding protein [Candidatus Adiutrix sp.]